MRIIFRETPIMKWKRPVISRAFLIFLLAGGAALPGKVAAQDSKYFTVTRLENLEFGTIVPAPGGGPVVIDAETGDRDLNGAVALGDGHRRAEFLIEGKFRRPFIITFLVADNDLRFGNERTGNITFELFPATGTIGADGTSTVFVGATLTLESDQLAGLYTGTFEIIVNKQ